MTIKEYIKNKKLSYVKIGLKLDIDAAHVFRALNGKRNSRGTLAKPSDTFILKMKKHFPELLNIYLATCKQSEE
jgi:hypothetical protein